jgi:hypothetical protein
MAHIHLQFRPVPKHWAIVRTNSHGPARALVIKSDCVRPVSDSMFWIPYDMEGLASATIDPMQPLTQERSLGSFADLESYALDKTQYTYRMQPLTLMQLGNEFFLDQKPPNMNVFSVLNNLRDLRQGVDMLTT